jgi:hypothetical protein
MTTDELKKSMVILINQHEPVTASELIFKLWMDHDSYRIKKGTQVVRKNLEDLSKEVDIADYNPA